MGARGRIARQWRALGAWRPWIVWLISLGFFLILQARHRDLPPYWDGTVNYIAAYSIQDNDLSPFLTSGDTGHPPLWAWLLAVLGRVGVPMLAGFHLLSWMCAATLLAGTWLLGRRVGGETVGWVSALLVGLNPCVVGQALQFNLDLPMAAFGVLAMALFADGRLWSAGVCAAVMTLSKLNGVFGVAPLAAVSLGLIAFDGRYRRRGALAGLAWMNLFPAAALGAYLGAKRLALGRTLDSGEYGGGNQVAFVANLSDYIKNALHSSYQLLANNGMWYFFCVLLMAAAMRWALWSRGVRAGGGEDGGEIGGARPTLGAGGVFALLALMAVFQVLAQSTRTFSTLPRYFMIAYPSLVVPVVWGIAASFERGRSRALALACAALVLGGVQVVKWHPKYWLRVHPALQLLFANPSKDTGTNHEWSLGFVEVLRNTRTIAKRLDQDAQPGENVGGHWPFVVYLTDPRLGMVARARGVTSARGDDWWRNPEKADYLVVYDWRPNHEPPPNGHPGARGLERVKYRTGETGSVALFRWRETEGP